MAARGLCDGEAALFLSLPGQFGSIFWFLFYMEGRWWGWETGMGQRKCHKMPPCPEQLWMGMHVWGWE